MKHLLILALLFIHQFASAQVINTPRFPVRGILSTPNGLGLDGYSVEIRGAPGRVGERSLVTRDGSFEFSAVEPGNYVVIVTDPSGRQIRQEFLSIHSGGLPITIRIPDPAPHAESGGVISAKRLMHKVPEKAQKEFRRSEKAFKEGDEQRSIALLKKAIEIDPEYMEARNNLGARYLRQNRYEEAIEQFQKAAELDPSSDMVNYNLAIALFSVGRVTDAEQPARAAVRSAPQSSKARYTLGVILATLSKGREALQNLARAAIDFPKAHLFAAQILARQGSVPEAAAELRAYLNSPETEKRAEVAQELKRLEDSQPATAPGSAERSPP